MKTEYQTSVFEAQNGFIARIDGGNMKNAMLFIAKTEDEAAKLMYEAIKEDANPKESDPDYYKELIEIIRDHNNTHEISIYTTKSTTIVEGYFRSNGKWMTMGKVECINDVESRDVVRTMIKNHFTSAPYKKSEVNHKGERLIRR